MTTGALTSKAPKNQAFTEDSLNDFFGFITDSPASENFYKLLRSLPDRRMAMELEDHVSDMILFAIERTGKLAALMSRTEADE